ARKCCQWLICCSSYSATAKSVTRVWAAVRLMPGRRPRALAWALTARIRRRGTCPDTSTRGASASSRPRCTPSRASRVSSMQAQRMAATPAPGGGRPPCTSTLEHPDLPRPGIQRQAQGGGGRVVSLAQGTAGKPQGLAGGGGQLQAAQAAVIDPLGPAQHGGATAGTQALLGRPQGFLLAGLHQYQPAQIDPG